ncbi:MAG TPA: CBS domain-containing protein [Firmicutes bacterium]|nr:CBS domain-containing protein [Bacillota bacterium]
MFVANRMTPNPITIREETSVLEALDIMRRHKVRRLPVLRGDQLVGIVTETDLVRVSPSPATTLSVFEMNYLLAKMQVRDVMSREVVTVRPDTTIEEAAVLMREHAIAGLPVIDGGRLVGIVTETNLFDALVDMMGLRRPGSRITVAASDRPGVLAEITRAVSALGINIISVATFPAATAPPIPAGSPGSSIQPEEGLGQVVLRVATTEPGRVVDALDQAGFKVLHVVVQNGSSPKATR